MSTVELPLIDNSEVFSPRRTLITVRPTVIVPLIDAPDALEPSVSGKTVLFVPLIDDEV